MVFTLSTSVRKLFLWSRESLFLWLHWKFVCIGKKGRHLSLLIVGQNGYKSFRNGICLWRPGMSSTSDSSTLPWSTYFSSTRGTTDNVLFLYQETVVLITSEQVRNGKVTGLVDWRLDYVMKILGLRVLRIIEQVEGFDWNIKGLSFVRHFLRTSCWSSVKIYVWNSPFHIWYKRYG